MTNSAVQVFCLPSSLITLLLSISFLWKDTFDVASANKVPIIINNTNGNGSSQVIHYLQHFMVMIKTHALDDDKASTSFICP